MITIRTGTLAAMLLAATALTPASAAEVFNRIATFHVVDNLPADADPAEGTVSEIIAATEDGMTLVYTDSPGKRVGIVDIAEAAAPKAGGTVGLDGEPTSVVIIGGKALVGVVTSESKADPSGHLAIVDIASKSIDSTCDLGGQPDSLVLSPDKSFLTVVIENERDEEVNDGAIPQLPGGNLTVFSLASGAVDCASRKVVALTGIAEIAPEDPEPEYVDVNSVNQAVVTLQENNHIAIVDLASGMVTSHFPAGTVDLDGIDTERNGIIELTGSKTGVLREPDTIQWIDDDRFVIANEGDLDGGSRGFTIFNKDGTVGYESGPTFEYVTVRLGHYPEHRSSKGNEPEGAEVATFGADKLVFIAAERASLVGVYKDEGAGNPPTFLQALPGGIGPEGLLAIPARNLFVTASETDLRADGLIGSVVTLYQRGEGEPAYPTIVSANDAAGKPIGWSALSGTVADKDNPGRIYVVTDSASPVARILTIDATTTPATITGAITVTRGGTPAELLDIEGIAQTSDGGFWLASEGNPEREEDKTQSMLVRVDASGAIVEEITIPESLAANATRFGFEGVTVTGTGDDELVWAAVQREWKDDAKGMVKLLAWKPATKEWSAVLYPLDTPENGWIGLSEITAVNGGLIIVERDNQVGKDAGVKALTYVSLDGVTPAPIGGELPVVTKHPVRDLIPDLAAPGGFVLDKVESFAIDTNGDAFIITDNDGVDDHSGETQFIRLGKIATPM